MTHLAILLRAPGLRDALELPSRNEPRTAESYGDPDALVRRAAVLGHVAAMTTLAESLQDDAHAARRRAAKARAADAPEGGDDADQLIEKAAALERAAVEWLRAAGERGDTDAICELARCHELGVGVPADAERARAIRLAVSAASLLTSA